MIEAGVVFHQKPTVRPDATNWTSRLFCRFRADASPPRVALVVQWIARSLTGQGHLALSQMGDSVFNTKSQANPVFWHCKWARSGLSLLLHPGTQFSSNNSVELAVLGQVSQTNWTIFKPILMSAARCLPADVPWSREGHMVTKWVMLRITRDHRNGTGSMCLS